MNRKQRDSNRLNAVQLKNQARRTELAKHICENCGEHGGHWVSTRGTSLAGLISGIDDQEGFWTCSKLYDPLTLRRLPGVLALSDWMAAEGVTPKLQKAVHAANKELLAKRGATV